MAGALALLGSSHALLVCQRGRPRRASISAPTRVVEVRDGSCATTASTPEERRTATPSARAVPGGDPAANAATTRAIFAGEGGAPRDMAVLNAGAAIYAAGRADTLAAGVVRAQGAIESGAATAKLDTFVARTRELAARRLAERLAISVNVLDRSSPARAVAVAARRAARPLELVLAAGRSGSAPEIGARSPLRYAAGHLADRRAQAQLTVGRADPRGRLAR